MPSEALIKQLADSLDKRLILRLKDGEIVEADIITVAIEDGQLVGELVMSNRLEKYKLGRAQPFLIQIADVISAETK